MIPAAALVALHSQRAFAASVLADVYCRCDVCERNRDALREHWPAREVRR